MPSSTSSPITPVIRASRSAGKQAPVEVRTHPVGAGAARPGNPRRQRPRKRPAGRARPQPIPGADLPPGRRGQSRATAPRAAGGVADSGQPSGGWRRDIICIMVKTSTFGRVAIFWLVASNRSAVNVISRRCYALCAVLHPSRAGTNRLKAPLLTDASGCRTPERRSGPGFGRLASSPLRAGASPPQHHPATTNSNTITACVDRIPCHFSDTHAQQLP